MPIRAIQPSTNTRLRPSLPIGALFLLLAQSPTTVAAVYKCAAKDGSTTYSDQPCDTNAQAVQVTPDPLHTAPKLATQSLAPGTAQLNQAHEQMVTLCARANYDAWYHTRSPKPTPEEMGAKLREALQTCRAIVPQNSTTPIPQAPAQTPYTSLPPATFAAAQDKSSRETKAILCSTKAFNEWIKIQGHPLPDPNVRIAKMVEVSNQCRRPLGLSDMIPPAPIPTPKPILQGPAGAAEAATLAQIVKSGSIERLQAYLSTPGVDINDRPGTDEALLDYAAEQNQAPVARFLLEHGARVDAVQKQGANAGYTALHRAAVADSAEVAQLLLAGGAEVNFHGPLGVTPLILAASNGSRRTVEILLEHGADVSTSDGHRQTALSEATAHNHADIVRLLLVHQPVPTIASMNALAMRGDLEALRLVVRHDELMHDINASVKDQALRFTILGGPSQLEERKQMIELLLADGADIDNQQPGLDVIPVMLAPTPEIAEFMFAHGANKKAKLSGAQLARWFVCNNPGKDPLGTLQVVVAHGIDISGSTPNGDSALPCATHANNAALVAFLQAHSVSAGLAHENLPNALPRPAAAASQGAQLFAKRACVQLDSIDNSHTPIELYSSLNDCVQNNRDSDAVSLFLLAGMDSSFDSLRVADKTAGQARLILIMALFGQMPPDVHTRFETAMKIFMDNPSRHATLCEQVKKVGPPSYFPAYMVNHGLGLMQSTLANQAPPTALEPNFDAQATWAQLQTSYLNCTDSKSGVARAKA
jgi:ankyrin repeat protein